jgi:predicted RNase H-like nuclease
VNLKKITGWCEMGVTLIGVDCATQAKNVGLALGYFDNGKARIEEVLIGSANILVTDTIVKWISDSQNALIALDAPLGWPTDLGRELHSHVAGNPIHVEPNQLFRRSTDKFIKSKIGKQPLDVGADRIARTAHAALSLLDEIRVKNGAPIPLAWEPGPLTGICAIEVYPAATLLAHDINVPGYKRKDGQIARRNLVNKLKKLIQLPPDTSLMANNDDAMDAVICCLAGIDFLRGEVMRPADIDVAKKEGWIWVRKPGSL